MAAAADLPGVVLPGAQGGALDVLHGDVDAVVVKAGVVDADDVLVAEGGEGLGFA